MIGGCSACQNATIISWATWRTNCSESSVSIGKFPKGIPANTSVPGWAFDNVTANANGTFDPLVALGETNRPDSTHAQGTRIHMIVGSVVGGVVGLALIALVASIFIKRSKNHRTGATNGKGSPVLQAKMKPQHQTVPYAPTPMSPPPGGIMNQQQRRYVRRPPTIPRDFSSLYLLYVK